MTTLCWALWMSRNDVVFNRTNIDCFLEIIFRGRIGSGNDYNYLKKKKRVVLKEASCRFNVIVIEVFGKLGW